VAMQEMAKLIEDLTDEVIKLKKEIIAIEKVLFDLTLYPNRCKYIYVVDLKEALIRRKVYIIKESGKVRHLPQIKVKK